MTEIELRVDTNEEQEFLSRVSDARFPDWGMTCKVVAYPCATHFVKYRDYVDHNVKVHPSYRVLYRCTSCGKTFKSKMGEIISRFIRMERLY